MTIEKLKKILDKISVDASMDASADANIYICIEDESGMKDCLEEVNEVLIGYEYDTDYECPYVVLKSRL